MPPPFWHVYLRQHSKPATRLTHYAGTLAAVALATRALVLKSPPLAAAALIAGYGPAWASHFFIEKNRPATFAAPLRSLVSDFRMLALAATGRLGRELRAAGVE